jgi:HTH-type transcriptional regulator/antitoxin HigA
MKTEIRPIRTAEDHEAALNEIERIWGAEQGTEEGDRLDVLATLVDAYEREVFPFLPPDPIDAILFRLDQMDLTRRDLEPILGSRGRVSEILNRQRGLSLAMIRKLNETFGIPLDILVQPTTTRKAS